jgi:hypothetical protein
MYNKLNFMLIIILVSALVSFISEELLFRSDAGVLLSPLVSIATRFTMVMEHSFTHPSKCAICIVTATAGIRQWST